MLSIEKKELSGGWIKGNFQPIKQVFNTPLFYLGPAILLP